MLTEGITPFFALVENSFFTGSILSVKITDFGSYTVMIDLIAYTGVISQDPILLKEAIKLQSLPQNAIFSTVNFFDIWAERRKIYRLHK